MDTEGCELGPFASAPDALALAAVERAERHGTEEVWIVLVAEHLGFKRSAHTTRRLRPQLECLRIAGELESTERLGRECWTLTDAGRERLASARRDGAVGDLPESPQHRRWRHARAQAAERIDDFRNLVFDAVDAADKVVPWAKPTGSEKWFELGERLRWSLWLVGSATYCLEEWEEPDDARADDVDDDPGFGPGRRSVSAWEECESRARGDLP